MPIIHPDGIYPYISSLRNHWIYAFSDRISLNTKVEEVMEIEPYAKQAFRRVYHGMRNELTRRKGLAEEAKKGL